MILIQSTGNIITITCNGNTFTGYQGKLLCSKDHTWIEVENKHRKIIGKVLISKLTKGVYLYFHERSKRRCITCFHNDVRLDISNMAVDPDIISKIEKSAMDYCKGIIKGIHTFDISSGPSTNNSPDIFDIGHHHMEKYLDTKADTLAYALLMHHYHKGGSSMIEYLSILF